MTVWSDPNEAEEHMEYLRRQRKRGRIPSPLPPMESERTIVPTFYDATEKDWRISFYILVAVLVILMAVGTVWVRTQSDGTGLADPTSAESK